MYLVFAFLLSNFSLKIVDFLYGIICFPYMPYMF